MTDVGARQRFAAFQALTAILRADPEARWPDQPVEWDALLELATQHSLLPALWSARRAAGRAVLPDAVARAIEGAAPPGRVVPELVLRRAYEANVGRTARLLEVAVDVLGQLDREGITAVPLKGLHMVLAGVWPDPAARTMADLDVLVPADAAPHAFDLLRSTYEEHPDAIGEHADHHLPMLRRDDVTIELHTELLVSRWSALAPAADVLARAHVRDAPPHGRIRFAADTDTFVHLVAHAQLQDDTYLLLGLPLRALFETARWLAAPNEVDLDEARRRFAAAGVEHVLTAHLDASHRWFGAPRTATRPWRAQAHQIGVGAGVVSPDALAAWGYVTRVPGSFTETRMVEEFGPSHGPVWLWRARAHHAVRRVAVRLRARDDG